MRIAVDAKLLSNPGSGIGRYTAALLEHMIPMGHQWLLYSERPFNSPLVDSPRVWKRTGHALEGSIKGLRWSQLSFARWTLQDVVDLFWSPRHHLPFLLPRETARVVTIHDMVWRQIPETMPRRRLWLERALMGPSVRAADKVICVSRFTASEVSRYFPSAVGKCEVIPCAADTEVAINTTPSFPAPEHFLLFVGTPEPRKNLPRLLRAYASLREAAALPDLVLVGARGWGDDNLPALIQELGIESRVHRPGHVSEADLQWLYAHATGLMMPSLYEGFGLPVLEAMQHGVPAIASSTSALPEVVGDAGLLVDPYSETEIANAISALLHEPGLRDTLSQRALARAGRFSWQRAAEETLAVFEAAHAGHRPRAYRHQSMDHVL
ncbi:MAG: glycosyltransferase family 1 protein [Halieaceae bacterium]|nr:glycosyltransferase family 1 protein [Halieaceae bacterium]